MTEFRELAQMIGEDIDAWYWYCCNSLSKEKSEYFTVWFKPTEEELKKYISLTSVF